MSIESTVQTFHTGSCVHADGPIENILHRLASLVAYLYETCSQLSRGDRHEIAPLEQKYIVTTMNSADSVRSQGKMASTTTIVALGILALSMGIGNENDKLFVQKMSELMPGISNLLTSQYSANQKNFDGMSQIYYQKLQDKINRMQSDGNIKETFAQVLQAELQRHRSASAGSH